ncbi:MAG: ABC transporter ATP-binding protein [Alphaproteobacteria bacterium]
MSKHPQSALAIKTLHKSFGDVEVLRDINVSIEPGDFLVLVGPSGCGKSTLLNCIAGLEETTSGEIWVADRNVTQTPPRDRDIAMVFQSYALYPTMTVAQNIGFGMRVRRVRSDQIEARVTEVASMLQIEHLLDRRPSQLSGGQRQRVAMGRALVRNPALFLFDEPLSNLDAKLRVEMRREIRELHQRTNTSMVYVTHDQVEAMTLATKIVILKNGEVQQVGTPDEIYHRPANTFVADFMGSPPMSLLTATRSDNLLELGGGSISLPVPPAMPADATALTVGIRPEDIAVDPEGPFSLETGMVEKTGPDAFVNLRAGTQTILARVPSALAPESGATVRVRIDLAKLAFFEVNSGQSL